VRFLLMLVLWATLLFVPSWYVAHPYQRALVTVAGALAVPGQELEFTDVEIFYPFDLGIFVALCLASLWAPWKRRGRAIGVGLPALVGVELLSLVVAIRVLLGVMQPAAGVTPSPADADAAYRLATGVIRVTGLIAAAAVWLYLLGRERLSIAARTWLGA
jgi:hypothetical protein